MFVPSRLKEERIFKADRALVNWNNRNPGKEYWPQTPERRVTVNGKRHDMTDEEYAAYSELAGRNTREILESGTGRLRNVDDPAESDIEAIRKAIRDGRSRAKRELFGRRR